jgi:hypothetical protein
LVVLGEVLSVLGDEPVEELLDEDEDRLSFL